MGHDVFISHSAKDKIVADAVCAALEASGVRCWIAPRDILPGESWASSILKGIASSRLMVLVFSAHTNASEQIRREVERAVHRGIAIAPVRIQDVMPEGDMEYFLSSQHWMDALTPPFEKHLKELSLKVRTLLSIGGDPPFAAPAGGLEAPEPVFAETPDAPAERPRNEREEQMRSLRDLFDADRLTPEQYKRGKGLLNLPAEELDEYDSSCRAQFVALVQGRLAPEDLAAALAGIGMQAQKDARAVREEAARSEALRGASTQPPRVRAKTPAGPPTLAEAATPRGTTAVPPAAPDSAAGQRKGPAPRPAPLPRGVGGAFAKAVNVRQAAPPPRKRRRAAALFFLCLLAIALAAARAWRDELGRMFSGTAGQVPKGQTSATPAVVSPALPVTVAAPPTDPGDVVPPPHPVAQPAPATAQVIAPAPLAKEFTNTLQMRFVRIESGEFDMGTPTGEAGRFDYETLHHVKITKPFLMAATPVTQAQWTALMGNNPSSFHGDHLPVEEVSWNDAVAFCGKLSQKEGKHYRLPTEAEWEYACRAGTQTAFSFGDEQDKLGDYAWYDGNSGNTTHDVGTRKPNPWGLYDMHGNVWQWCSDIYGPYPGDGTDPKGPQQGDANASRVLRGGSWGDGPRLCRAGCRCWLAPGRRFSFIGFRLVLDSE